MHIYRASMENVVGSDYAGSHWLATFLMYALGTRDEQHWGPTMPE